MTSGLIRTIIRCRLAAFCCLMLDKESVNRYVLEKSHLLPETKSDSVGAVLRDLVALDANNLSDTYFSLYLRVNRFDVGAFEKGLYKGTSMARVKGLKNNMQIVFGDYLPAVYSLTKNDRESAAKSTLKTWGITEDEDRKLEMAILESLDDKEKTLTQLKTGLSSVSRDIIKSKGKRKEKAMNVSVVAGVMLDRWLLLRGGIGRQPGESPGRFSTFKSRFGDLKLDMDRDKAISLLAKRYVRGYGPVTVDDLAWWLGVTLGEAKKALANIGGLKAVEIEGVQGQFFMDEKDEVQRTTGGPTVMLLPKDDPYVKAYFNTARFVPAGHKVMTKFGESASVVLINGTVWGTWSMEKDRLTEACRVTMFAGSPEIPKEQIEAAAATAGHFYSGGPVEVILRSDNK